MVGPDLVERALRQNLTFGHDDHRIAQMGDEAHVVLDQEHGDAALGQLQQAFGDLVLQGRIDAGRRLVEQHQPGLGHQRAPYFQEFLLAAGQRRRRIVDQVIEPQEARRLPRPLGEGRLALARRLGADHRLPQAFARLVAAVEHEVLEHREPGEAAGDLKGADQALPADGIGGPARDVTAVEANRPRIRRHQAGNHVEQRRLARAIGPDQAGDTAGQDGEVDAAQHVEAVEGTAKVLELEQRQVSSSPRTRDAYNISRPGEELKRPPRRCRQRQRKTSFCSLVRFRIASSNSLSLSKPEDARKGVMSLAVTLDDKYVLERGRVYLTGTQALVRLPMMQRQRDLAAGLNTAGYISGYRGSPLGGFDQALWQAKRFIKSNHIEFQPGTNEDLAATALWGTQQIHLYPGARYDGVFGIWYGKGPGVDRSGDVLKHANYAGTARHGGIMALAGDDHMAKSSTTAHQSEPALIAAAIPIIHAASVQEYLDLGLHGFALSRYSGLWVGFKVVSETVDSSASVHVDPHRIEIKMPTDFILPPDGVHIRWPDDWLGQERRVLTVKHPAALAYWRANQLDRLMMGRSDARFGIVTVGKSYLDVRQALDELGIDDDEAGRLGLAVYKVALVWPLEPEGVSRFAQGKRELLVVEEKRPIIEQQLKDVLFNAPADRRPVVVGKTDERGQKLLKSDGELTPFEIASALVARLGAEALSAQTRQRFEALQRRTGRQVRNESGMARVPYFCSGCPHNSSTRVPDGSMAMAGIGCHTLAINMDRNTKTFTHMGAEGAPWVGASHFSDMPHVFQNLGDGTYFHSGYLAIRHAVATNTNITYKILYNDAVAMTGGQPHDGDVHPWTISRQVHAEGVRRIALVSDDPDKYPPGTEWAPGTTFHHRRELDDVQRGLREVKGVSVLFYDQTCAAEKRRRRKRGTFPDPARRVFINQAVCEGCGDCSTQSNCLSVVPVETELGTKRAIDQSSCNKDFSCLKGFCPSFVTVEGGSLRKGKATAAALP